MSIRIIASGETFDKQYDPIGSWIAMNGRVLKWDVAQKDRGKGIFISAKNSSTLRRNLSLVKKAKNRQIQWTSLESHSGVE